MFQIWIRHVVCTQHFHHLNSRMVGAILKKGREVVVPAGRIDRVLLHGLVAFTAHVAVPGPRGKAELGYTVRRIDDLRESINI